MDDVQSIFESSFRVSSDPNDTAAPHPRFSQYKQKDTILPQEVRRKRFLEAIKDKRFDYLQYVRSLADGNISVDDTYDSDEEGMDWTTQPKKPPRTYKNQLMLSEWLVEVPSDFATEWLMVLCPVGKRSLVVSCKGKTCAYTKSGYMANSFPSVLPGGNRRLNCGPSEYTLLDCIYSETERTYYVLDMMCWKCQPIFDSDTEFRFFWLHSKLSEIPEVQVQSKLNPYKFCPVPSFACDPETLRTVLGSPLPFRAQLDGLLFYCKQTHYTHGRTPLVGWLKAHMVPTLLGVEVPVELCVNKPPEKKHSSTPKEKRTKKKVEKMVTS